MKSAKKGKGREENRLSKKGYSKDIQSIIDFHSLFFSSRLFALFAFYSLLPVTINLWKSGHGATMPDGYRDGSPCPYR